MQPMLQKILVSENEGVKDFRNQGSVTAEFLTEQFQNLLGTACTGTRVPT